jgi:hypothetical protein
MLDCWVEVIMQPKRPATDHLYLFLKQTIRWFQAFRLQLHLCQILSQQVNINKYLLHATHL